MVPGLSNGFKKLLSHRAVAPFGRWSYSLLYMALDRFRRCGQAAEQPAVAHNSEPEGTGFRKRA